MAEQMPGELIYKYDGLRITRVTSYGAPPFDLVVSGAAAIPPPGARYDFTLEGRVDQPRLRGTFNGVDYLHVRPDGRAELHIHAEIDDGRRARRSRYRPAGVGQVRLGRTRSMRRSPRGRAL